MDKSVEEDEDCYSRKAQYDEYAIDLSKVYYRKITEEIQKRCLRGALLDIGCYDGTFAATFLKSGYQVFGIEAHDGAYRSAVAKGVQAVKQDIEAGLPWADDHFDVVIAAEVIEHVYDTDGFLSEIKRVLKKEGILVLSIPNVACLTNRFKMLLGGYPRYCEYQAGASGGHIRVYTLPAIQSQLQSHGFKILRSRGANFPLPMHTRGIPDFFKKIAVRLGDFAPGIAGQFIIAAQNRKA